MTPNYQRPAFSPCEPRPAKGERTLELREARISARSFEDEQKDLCRFRDKRCRYPHCPFCARYKDQVLQAAHVLQAKGMSGDRTGERSLAERLMLLCPPIHGLQEKHDIDVVPVDETRGTDGPCEFWRRGEDRQMYLVARETAPFVYERD